MPFHECHRQFLSFNVIGPFKIVPLTVGLSLSHEPDERDVRLPLPPLAFRFLPIGWRCHGLDAHRVYIVPKRSQTTFHQEQVFIRRGTRPLVIKKHLPPRVGIHRGQERAKVFVNVFAEAVSPLDYFFVQQPDDRPGLPILGPPFAIEYIQVYLACQL